MARQARRNRDAPDGRRRAAHQASTGRFVPRRAGLDFRGRSVSHRPRRYARSRRLLAGVLSLSLAASLAVAVPALADPDSGDGSSTSQSKPTTSEQAKKAWLEASDKADAANEDLLTAKQHEKRAKADAAQARVTVARATLAASSAQSASVRAAAKYSDLREQLGAFASASFRGARLGQLSALLTAESSSDYLDEVSSLDHVAGRTQKLMIRALKAKRQADSASDKADDAQQKAVGARQKADKAVEAAHRATQNVTHRKSDLESRVKKYHQLFNRLSASERRAAMRAQQEAWEKQTRQAQREAKKEARRDAQRWAQQESPQTGAFGDGADGGPGTSGNGEDGHAGDGASSAVRSKAEKAVRAALTKLGNPYVYGTAGPTTFDCSGLTSWAWAQAGVSIPRTSAAQGRLQSVPLDQLEPGDLVTYYSPVHHVALYIGHGQIIDASTEGRPIFITSVYRGGPYPTGHRVTY